MAPNPFVGEGDATGEEIALLERIRRQHAVPVESVDPWAADTVAAERLLDQAARVAVVVIGATVFWRILR